MVAPLFPSVETALGVIPSSVHSSADACRAGCADGTTIPRPERAGPQIAFQLSGLSPNVVPATSRGLDESPAGDCPVWANPAPLAGTILVQDDIGEHSERTNGCFRQT